VPVWVRVPLTDVEGLRESPVETPAAVDLYAVVLDVPAVLLDPLTAEYFEPSEEEALREYDPSRRELPVLRPALDPRELPERELYPPLLLVLLILLYPPLSCE